MQTVSIRDLVVEHAERVSAGPHFWSIPLSETEPIRHVHIYEHTSGHFHYVTDGLHRSLRAVARGRHSEIELTMRTPRREDSPLPQPIDFLRRLALLFLEQPVPSIHDTAVFEPPLGPERALAALAYVADVELTMEDGRELLRVSVEAAAVERFARSASPEGDAPLDVGPCEVRFVDEP